MNTVAAAISDSQKKEAAVDDNRAGAIFGATDHLQDIADDLKRHVTDWHGLDVSRFGALQLYGTANVSKNKETWETVDCFLFTKIFLCAKKGEESQYRLKGSILVKEHLKDVSVPASDGSTIILRLSVAEPQFLYLRFEEGDDVELWRQSLLDTIPSDKGKI